MRLLLDRAFFLFYHGAGTISGEIPITGVEPRRMLFKGGIYIYIYKLAVGREEMCV